MLASDPIWGGGSWRDYRPRSWGEDIEVLMPEEAAATFTCGATRNTTKEDKVHGIHPTNIYYNIYKGFIEVGVSLTVFLSFKGKRESS